MPTIQLEIDDASERLLLRLVSMYEANASTELFKLICDALNSFQTITRDLDGLAATNTRKAPVFLKLREEIFSRALAFGAG
jgi:hypothetical protein